MKKKELIFIICLIIIAALIIAGMANAKKNNNQGNNQIAETQDEGEESRQRTGLLTTGDTQKYSQVQEDGSKINVSPRLSETKTYKDLKITNSRVTEIDGVTTLLADVENTGKKKTEDMTLFDITFIDDENNELVKLVGSVIPLEPGQTTQLNAGITEDIAGAYDYKTSDHVEE